MTTPIIGNLTINGVVQITANAASILNINGNIDVSTGSLLENNGRIYLTTSGKTFNLNGTATYVHNPLNTALIDESIFSNGVETFSATSTLDIKKWGNGSIPLGNAARVGTSNFGNLILEAAVPGGVWDQDGYFTTPTPGRIKGTLTVSEGTVVMDDGSGFTTSLTLQDVVVNNNGNIIFQRGGNRNLTLVTGNFTVNNAIPGKPTIVMDTSYGVLNWTVNGNMNLNSDFNAVNGNGFVNGADIRVSVTGNFNYTGGNVLFVKQADAPCRVTVTGNTIINNAGGNGSLVFIEGGNGNFTLNTNDLNLISGNGNYFMGKPGVVMQNRGIGAININNDFNVLGAASLCFAYADSNTNKMRIAITRDFNLSAAATVTGAYTGGAFTFRAGRNMTITNGWFNGQTNSASAGIDSIICVSAYTFNSNNSTSYFKANKGTGNTFFNCGSFTLTNSGTGYGQGVALVDSGAANLTFAAATFTQNGGQFSGILSGSGNLTFNVTGMLDMNAGIFRGHYNTIYSNPGIFTFNAGSIDYDGGLFSCFYNCSLTGSASVVTISGVCKVNFTSTTDEFTFIGLAGVGFDLNNIGLSVSISGGLTIQGADGTFISSRALGAETVSMPSMTISAGKNSFNSVTNSPAPNGHNVTMLISGNVTISGGNTFLSGYTQTYTGTINGNLSISGGSLSVKGGDCTSSTLNVLGSYTQTGGDFYLHNCTNDELAASSTITINFNSNDDANGDFTHTGGNFVYDNSVTTPAALNLIVNVKAINYTIGGTGVMTMTKAGTGTVFGILNFAHVGTTSFNRSGSHLIQQVTQNVITGCTLDIASGDVQIASNNSTLTPPQFFWVNLGATVNAHQSKIYSNGLNANSGITILGRLRTQHPNGLYNGTQNATFSTNITDNLDYFLSTTSTIEYNATTTQVITGIGIGKAISFQHKYGNLDVNNGGIANTDFAYPTNLPNDSAVMVRGNLVLTNGELNLDSDHNPSNSGGRKIVLESGATTAMQRTNGYVRCETEDGSAQVKWIIGSTAGNHTFHFGFNSTSYIPFVFAPVSGNAGNVFASTYHTATTNLPYPPTVTHVRNNSGADNSGNTVDRFWLINTPTATSLNANLTFNCTAAEASGITGLLAQRWISGVNSWTNPIPGTQTSITNGTTAIGITALPTWWTLSGNATLLPVKLVNFSGQCDGDNIKLNWTTATEINNSYFEIEKSIDGSEYSRAGLVSGSGNSTTFIDYSFTDWSASQALTYYRLKQVDYDGHSEIFGPIAIKACHDRQLNLNAWAIGKELHLSISSDQSGSFRVEIIDVNGKQILSSELHHDGVYSEHILELPVLSSGIYLLQLQSETQLLSRKIFIEGR